MKTAPNLDTYPKSSKNQACHSQVFTSFLRQKKKTSLMLWYSNYHQIFTEHALNSKTKSLESLKDTIFSEYQKILRLLRRLSVTDYKKRL